MNITARPVRVLAAALIVALIGTVIVTGLISGDSPWNVVKYAVLGF